MSDSSKELQDEVPEGPRYYAFALKGHYWIPPGTQVYKTYAGAKVAAHHKNENKKFLQAIKKPAPQPVVVVAVYPSRKKDVKYDGSCWRLSRGTRAHYVTEQDALAFAVEEAMGGIK
jgi:hypothetical protein